MLVFTVLKTLDFNISVLKDENTRLSKSNFAFVTLFKLCDPVHKICEMVNCCVCISVYSICIYVD